MTPIDPQMKELVKQVLREELSGLLASDRYIFQKQLQLADGRNITIGGGTGTIIGGTDAKLGFFGKAPVVQQTVITEPSGGAVQDAESRYAIIEIKTLLTALGLTT
jgi:hypothetical protein